jgi:hypothetical protein
MQMRYITLPLVLLMLAGCGSSAQRAAKQAAIDNATCEGYGLRRGTDAFAQCRMLQDARRDAQQAAFAAKVGQAIGSYEPVVLPTFQQPPQQRLQTSCRYFGQTLYCD